MKTGIWLLGLGVFLLACSAQGASNEPLISTFAMSQEPVADKKALGWQAWVQAYVRRAEYRIEKGPATYRPERGEAYQAPNRMQNLRFYFGPEGVEVLDRTAKGALTLARLSLRSWGREIRGYGDNMTETEPGRLVKTEDGLSLMRPGIEEWYVNTPAGLEIGWTVTRRPTGKDRLILRVIISSMEIRRNLRRAGREVRHGGLRVTDAHGQPVPAEVFSSGWGVGVRVADNEAVYPLTISLLITACDPFPRATLASDQPIGSSGDDRQLGASVAGAGDVNGDGYDDVIVGGVTYENGDTWEGAAYVFLGSAAGITGSDPGTAGASLETGDYIDFGASVAGAGDVNGDGYGDVIVAAPHYDNGETKEGAVFVFLGSASGIVGSGPGTANAFLESNQSFSGFGESVAGAGDVNGDGYDDVIIGADSYENGEIREGAAFVFLGSESGIVGSDPTTAHATLESNQDDGNVGASVAAAGDVNGDGYDDVIVGATYYDTGKGRRGVAIVLLGSASGIVGSDPATAHAILEINPPYTGFGASVAGAGDVNGDGYDDVIVGAPDYDHGKPNEGAAFVFLGSASGISSSDLSGAQAVVQSNQYDAALGTSVAGAGDVNRDGYDDVIVGAPQYDHDQEDEGAAFVFLGSAEGIASTTGTTRSSINAYAILESNQEGAQMGATLAAAGDVNGDGYDDVIVGAPDYYANRRHGGAFVFLGSPSGVSRVDEPATQAILESAQADAAFGASIARAGDVNGDGYGDVIVGAPEYDNGETDEGAAFVFLGSDSGIRGSDDAAADAILESNQEAALLGSSVAGAGDVNGDGYGDLIVGAPAYDHGEPREGAVLIFLGSDSGIVGSDAATAHATLESNLAHIGFGASVAGAGDVNADGYDDLIVGAPTYRVRGLDRRVFNQEAVYVFLGSASGITGSDLGAAQATLKSEQYGSTEFGSSVAGAGDVNGDGYRDIIVGAPYYDHERRNEGTAFVFLGSASGISGSGPVTASATLESDQAAALLGRSVAGAGDMNGDGFSDVIVGAPRYDFGEPDEGVAFVFLGSASGIVGSDPDTAGAVLQSNQAFADFGSSVAGAGDVNKDGYGDVIVGAPGYDNGESDEGAGFVFLGSAEGITSTTRSSVNAYAVLDSNQAGLKLGASVAGAGDVNGDGYDDVIIGAHSSGNGDAQGDEGAAFVFLGAPRPSSWALWNWRVGALWKATHGDCSPMFWQETYRTRH